MGRRWIILALASSAVVACGECTTCAPSAESVHEEHGRRVTVKGQAFTDIGVDGFGAPHVGGILWPTLEGAGYRIGIEVDDREPVAIAAKRTDVAPGSSRMEELVSGVEVDVSPDGEHVAVRIHGPWRVLHLLPAGTPFDVPGSEVEADAVDWSAFGTAEEEALEALAADGHGADHPLLWQAVEAQPAREPWDDAVLAAWPAAEPARETVLRRLARGGEAPSDDWRERASARAREVVEAGGEAQGAAMDLLVLLGGDAVHWLDRRMIDRWSDSAAPVEERRAARDYLNERLVGGPWVLERAAPPMGDATERQAVDAARRVLGSRSPSAHPELTPERRRSATVEGRDAAAAIARIELDLALALRLVETHGTEEDRAWADRRLLEEWPAPAFQRVHAEVLERVRDGETALDYREAAKAEALSALEDGGSAHDAAELLLALDDEAAAGQAIDTLFERLTHEDVALLRQQVQAGTPRRREQIHERAAEIVEGGESGAGAPRAEQLRFAYAAHLAFLLEEGEAPCDRLRDLLEASSDPEMPHLARRLPVRCREPGR